MKSRWQWKSAKRSFPLLIVALFCLKRSSAKQGVSRPQSRELALQCPIDEFNGIGNRDEIYEGRFDAYSQGGFGISLMERIRTKPESYYQNLVDNVIMLLCNVETASERCIEKDSPYAAKDWSGENCIKAADHGCPRGTCERASNCYWNSVYEGQNRTTRFPVDAYENAATALYGTDKSYAREIALYPLIATAIAFLLLLCWVIFFVGRYMCCCLWVPCSGPCFLCSPIPQKDGYRTFVQVHFPKLLYLAALLGVTLSMAMAFLGNEDASIAISNTFLHSDGLVEDLGIFLGRSRIPLENINDIVEDAAMDAKSIFDGTEYVRQDAVTIVDSFLGYFELHSQGLNDVNAMETFDSASLEFQKKVTPVTENVQAVLDTLELDLYGQADIIKGGITSALEQLEGFSGQSVDWQNTIYKYEGRELGVRTVRRAGVMALFLISFLLSVIGFVGILFSKRRTRLCSIFSHMVKVTGFFSAWLGSLSLVVASIFLIFSFVLFDACQMSAIVTRDLEPFVGDKVSPGANACFNDTNLAVAFNVTEKVNFQQKLDEGLSQIEQVNVTEKFQLVLEPIGQVSSMLGKISNSALLVLNQFTASSTEICPFADEYTKDTLQSPWNLLRDNDSTPYKIGGTQGSFGSFARMGLEDSEAYFGRIYNITGICSATSDCCLFDPLEASCVSLAISDDCDHGANCKYPCAPLTQGITEGYKMFTELHEREMAMTSDLGVECPVSFLSCPTDEYKAQYANLTLVGLIDDYKGKIIGTKDSLVNLASTSVGETMTEVEDFLCNMNVSFIERRYDEVKNDICGTMFGGVAQLNCALWLLGVSLEVIAILAHILSVRLQGLSEKEAAFTVLEERDLDGRLIA